MKCEWATLPATSVRIKPRRWEIFLLYIICPHRNSYIFSFLACLLLTLVLMVHVIIIAWSLWLFSIFTTTRCRELEIYSTTYRTVAKRGLTYFLFHFLCSSAGAKPAHVTVAPQLYLYQRKGGLYLITYLISFKILKYKKKNPQEKIYDFKHRMAWNVAQESGQTPELQLSHTIEIKEAHALKYINTVLLRGNKWVFNSLWERV